MLDPPKNLILASLPSRDHKHLLPMLKLVSLNTGSVLYQPYQDIEHLYFPETAVITKLVILEDGSSAEVGMVGREGVAGLCLFLESAVSPFRAVVQVAGEALSMDAEVFRKELRRSDERLGTMLRKYTAAFLVQVSHLVACNQLHSVKQRCCRMLLSTFDRVDAEEVPFTQDSLAFLLGVRRASVGDVMVELKKAKLLRYARGRIVLLDRAGLETAACECYRHIRAASSGVFGPEGS